MTEEQKEKARQRARKWYAENKKRALANRKKHYEKNKEEILIKIKEYKEKNKERVAEWGKARGKRYRERHKEELKLRAKKRFKEDEAYRERCLRQARESLARRKAKNPEYFKQQLLEWKKNNPEKVKQHMRDAYQKNKKDVKRRLKIWLKENKDKVRQYRAEYKARKIKATPKWYEQERCKIEAVYQKAQEFGFDVDHIVPIRSKKVCGLHTWANLQLLAPDINRAKSNRTWPDMP